MKYLDKLKSIVKINKKLVNCFVILMVIGIIFGSIFMVILNDTDKSLIKDYYNNFISNVNNNTLNYFFSLKSGMFNNLLYITIIWALGISIIGIPIVIFMFFIKSFILGFSISSIMFNFKLKGCLLSFVSIFPHQIINFIVYIIITIYSISFSIRLINSIIKKKQIDFKLLMNKYLKILIISVILIILSILIETFITPILIKIIIPIIK